LEKTSLKDWKRYTIKSLAFWVVVGIVAGITLGMLNPSLAVQAKPGIDWFIQVLKWLVGPIIFLTIISGIVGLESLKEVGSIGLKAFIYFEVVSTFALAIGILFGNLLKPGHGMHLNVESLDVSAVSSFTANASSQTGSVWGILKKCDSDRSDYAVSSRQHVAGIGDGVSDRNRYCRVRRKNTKRRFSLL